MKWYPIEKQPEDVLKDPAKPVYLIYVATAGEMCLANRMKFDTGWVWESGEKPRFMRQASHWAVVTPPRTEGRFWIFWDWITWNCKYRYRYGRWFNPYPKKDADAG